MGATFPCRPTVSPNRLIFPTRYRWCAVRILSKSARFLAMPVFSTNSETYLPGTFRFGSLPFAALFTTAQRAAISQQITTDVQAGVITPTQAGLLGTTLSNQTVSTINALQAYNASAPQVYQQGFGLPYFATNTDKFSLFGQDTWKARPNITLSYGLRYSFK